MKVIHTAPPREQTMLSGLDITRICDERTTMQPCYEGNVAETLEPLKDRVLLRLIQIHQPYPTIIRPQTAAVDKTTRFARVIRVGGGKRTNIHGVEKTAASVRPGDVVVIGAFADWESKDGNYVICEADDCRAIVTEVDLPPPNRGDVLILPKHWAKPKPKRKRK